MQKTWIIVAGSARARIFTPVAPGEPWQTVHELQHPAARAHESELTSDGRGRTFDSQGPGRHAMGKSVPPKEHEAGKLRKELVDTIESARNAEQFERLVLVAAPALLGDLRKDLSAPAARLVDRELDKNLAHMSVHEIMEHLPNEVASA